MAKNNTLLLIVVAVVGIFLVSGGSLSGLFGGSQTTVVAPPASAPQVGAGCNQNPVYTWSGVDFYNKSEVVAATNYTKINGMAPTSNGNAVYGQPLSFWLYNSTRFCAPVSPPGGLAECGNQILQATCYGNGTSLSTTMWDDDNNVLLGASAAGTNVTIGANGIANLILKYKAVAKAANMPFGGCAVIEFPTTITDVIVSGSGLSNANPCNYQVTYTVGNATNTYRTFAVPTGFDAAGDGLTKDISVQLRAGSSNPSGHFFVQFIPANYYVANDGTFDLNTEQAKNSATTRTAPAPARAYWYIE